MDIRCTHCKVVKTDADFYQSVLKTSTRWCKVCMRTASREWAANNRGRSNARVRAHYQKNKAAICEAHRHYDRMKKYGVTKDQYIVMLAHQEHRCAVCDGSLIGKSRVSIDHNHTTGKVRGILCDNCNRGIGLLKDNPDVLAKAARYLLAS